MDLPIRLPQQVLGRFLKRFVPDLASDVDIFLAANYSGQDLFVTLGPAP